MPTKNSTHKTNKVIASAAKDAAITPTTPRLATRELCYNNSHTPMQKLSNESSNHSFLFTIKDEESRGEITSNLLSGTGSTSHIINEGF